MLLSKAEIRVRYSRRELRIDPFNEDQLGPNSYDVQLGDKLLIYKDEILDSRAENKFIEIDIPEEGFVMRPGILYLGTTVEKIWAGKDVVGQIDGRSSIARLGIVNHLTAGFSQVGFDGKWTLEMTCVHPVKIYKNMRIGQVYFHTVEGPIYDTYKGKYQNQDDVQASKLHEDILKPRYVVGEVGKPGVKEINPTDYIKTDKKIDIPKIIPPPPEPPPIRIVEEGKLSTQRLAKKEL